MADEDRTRWNAKYRAADAKERPASAALQSVASWLPRNGRAVDLAGGDGSNAIWLAQRGLDVTVVDIADAGLELGAAAAARAGVPLETLRLDLERNFPEGPWDLITCINYIERAMWPRATLAAGGVLVWVHPTMTNLERHQRPSARYLLGPDEGRSIIAALPGIEVRRVHEGWVADRHLCTVVAQRIRRTS